MLTGLSQLRHKVSVRVFPMRKMTDTFCVLLLRLHLVQT